MEDDLLTFLYIHKYSSAVMTISSINFNDAEEKLQELVKNTGEWRCEDEDGIKE